MGQTYQGRFDARGRKVALVVSRFNDFITRELVAGARDALLRHGTADADIDIVWVPGSFELPLAAQRLARSRRYGAVVCLGCLIEGDTPHFTYLAAEVIKGVAQVCLESELRRVRRHHGRDARTGDRASRNQGRQQGFDAALAAVE
jgi:6,7-dimethyl-8-ribityllumazine synthase